MPLTNAERQARFRQKREQRLKRSVPFDALLALRETLASSRRPEVQRLAGQDVADMLRLLTEYFRAM